MGCRPVAVVIMHVHKYEGHCATSRKVAGSIPDGAIGFFH
jgi:hypothetical protein